MLQCAQYFPEELSQRGAYGGWRVECTSLQEVDSDVSRRDLVVTPPRGSGMFHFIIFEMHPSACTKSSTSYALSSAISAATFDTVCV